MKYQGNYNEDATIDFKFHTHKEDGTPITLGGSPALAVYKANGTTESTAGITLSVDFDGVTGMHHVRVVTTDAYYAVANDYQAIITSGTVDGKSVVGYVIGEFSIQNRFGAGLTLQQVRDAMKLAPTGGAPAAGSVDEHLDDIDTKTTNLPADPASETNVNANETKIDAVKVDTAAIKLKTDNLPGDPASETNVNANETKIDTLQADVTAVKNKTDDLNFNSDVTKKVLSDVRDVNDVAVTGVNDFKADVSGLSSQASVDIIDGNVDTIKAKTDQLAFSSANKVDANMKAIDEQATNGNNATLKLKKLDIQNTGDKAIQIQSDTDHAVDIQTTVSGNGINIISKGTGMNIQGEGAGVVAKAGVSGDGMIISAAGSNKHGLKITSGSGAFSSGIFVHAQSPSGSGILAQADTMHGMELKGGASGKDIDADEIDDIKAKTDNLPADPASESNVDANETKIDALPSASDIDTQLSGSHGSGSWESGSFWTDAELKQIRDALGIDGIKVAAVNGQLQAIKSGVDGMYTTPLVESYSTKGATKTMAQFMYEIRQFFLEFAYTPTGKRVVKKLNQTTTAKEFQLDDVNLPTANTEVV